MLFRLLCFFIGICFFSLGECARNLKDIQRCIRLIAFYERKYFIPKGTLHSISLVETGTFYSNPRYRVPWPWTLNVEGKGQRFDTAQEAKAFLRGALKKGIKNIDVGCMQVNLSAHPKAFSSLQDALEPESNIRYAAEFLRKKYVQLGSWSKAVRHYHSSDSFKGLRYYCNVEHAKREVAYGLALVDEKTFVARNSGVVFVESKPESVFGFDKIGYRRDLSQWQKSSNKNSKLTKKGRISPSNKIPKNGGLLRRLFNKLVKKSTFAQKRQLTGRKCL